LISGNNNVSGTIAESGGVGPSINGLWWHYNILHLSREFFVQNPIPKLDNLCLCESLCHNHLDLIICLYKPFTNFHVVYIETPINPITLCPNFLVISLIQLSQQFHNRITQRTFVSVLKFSKHITIKHGGQTCGDFWV
jgi:hypothetical protein